MAQAIARVFARLGEKKQPRPGAHQVSNRQSRHRRISQAGPGRAAKAGRRSALDGLTWHRSTNRQREPLKPGSEPERRERPEGFDAWYATNVYKQRQPGYVAATVTLPLGDASADQLRALADIARRFVKDTLRTTVEQNILFRWVSEADLPEFYHAIKAIGLGAPDAAPSST